METILFFLAWTSLSFYIGFDIGSTLEANKITSQKEIKNNPHSEIKK